MCEALGAGRASLTAGTGHVTCRRRPRPVPVDARQSEHPRAALYPQELLVTTQIGTGSRGETQAGMKEKPFYLKNKHKQKRGLWEQG